MRVLPSDCDSLAERRSLPALIGWLSLCMLSAGYGPQLPTYIRQTWIVMGLFGLAAAMGLNVAARARHIYRKRLHRKTTERRVDFNLTRLVKQHATFQQIREALSRIAEDYGTTGGAGADQRAARRMPFSRPVRVEPIDSFGHSSTDRLSNVIRAFVRDLSANGVGLIHNRPIDARQVVLTFDLLAGETISFIVDLNWSSLQADGKYLSGGKMIDIAAVHSGCSEDVRQVS